MNRRHLIAALAVLAAPRRAFAYVPPGDFLLGRAADKRKGLKTVQVTGIRTYLGRSFEGGKQDVAETIWGGPDGAYRIERKTPKGEYLEVSDGKRRVTVVDGKAGAIEADPHALDRMLMLTGVTKDELIGAVRNFGIRPDVTALGRLDGRVVWIIGAKEGDVASPQLWLDKDRSFPVLLDDPRSKRRVRYEGWGESTGSSVMPSRVSWLKGGNVEEELKIESVKSNPKLGADLFKPDAPILAPTPTPTPKATPKSSPKPAATKKPVR